jgi:hypothetical protein
MAKNQMTDAVFDFSGRDSERNGQARTTIDLEQKHAFAIVHTWPEIKNAEYEIIQRVIKAADNIGATVYVVDDNGYHLHSNRRLVEKSERIQQGDCDFLISLHFESPRLLDIFSYAALWNPLNFYSMFGYHSSIEKLASHNDVLSCRSDVADVHAANLFEGMGRGIQLPAPPFFHTVPGPFLKPNIGVESRLFYIGINWERISGKKGRHHDLLQLLDEEDLIRIYGPKKFQGVEPWEGFRCYAGAIPFDGNSVLAKINEAGICLVLSSSSHQQSGIMSSRLFEGLAAGAVIISNPHPLIEKYFSDCVFVVDDKVSPLEFSKQIRALVLKIRENPSDALELARRGQKRFCEEGFNLEYCLSSLFASHSIRKENFATKVLGNQRYRVSVLLNYPGLEAPVLLRMIDYVTKQKGVEIALFLLCDLSLVEQAETRIATASRGNSIESVEIFADSFYVKNERGGPASRVGKATELFARALKAIKTEFFCTVQADDFWFEDHLASLVQALHKQTEAPFACSGRITETISTSGKFSRSFDELSFRDFSGLTNVSHSRDVGRFLYRTNLLSELPDLVFKILPMIDGQEHRLLNLWASLIELPVQTNYASYVQMDHFDSKIHIPHIDLESQLEIIRDTVRGSSVWLMRLSNIRQLENTITELHSLPKSKFDRFPRVELDNVYAIPQARLNGFYPVEGNHFAWIKGKSATLQFDIGRDISEEAAERWLMLVVAGRKSIEGETQRCTILINDEEISSESISDRLQRRHFKMPQNLETGLLRVELKLAHADILVDRDGKTKDSRKIGLGVHRFAVVTKWPLLQIKRDRTYDFGRDGQELALVTNGFYEFEGMGAWIDGTSACIDLELEPNDRKSWLAVHIAGRNSSQTGSKQKCTISVNNRILGSIAVGELVEEHYLEMPISVGRAQLSFELAHAEQVLDDRGEVMDPRNLGLCIKSFGIMTKPAANGSSQAGFDAKLIAHVAWKTARRSVRRLRRLLS